MADIDNNFTKITELKSFTPNQIKVANIYFMVSGIFTGKTKKFLENNEDELYLFKSKSNHSNEQKESKIARQSLLSNQMNNQTLQICLI